MTQARMVPRAAGMAGDDARMGCKPVSRRMWVRQSEWGLWLGFRLIPSSARTLPVARHCLHAAAEGFARSGAQKW